MLRLIKDYWVLIAGTVAASSAFAVMRADIDDLEVRQQEQSAYVYRIPVLEAKIEGLRVDQDESDKRQAQILRLSNATDRNIREVKRYLRRQAGERVHPTLDMLPPPQSVMVDE